MPRWISKPTEDAKKQIQEDKMKEISQWHVWFAWYPVVVSTEGEGSQERQVKVWLRNVMRRAKWIGICEDGTLDHDYEYKEQKEVVLMK